MEQIQAWLEGEQSYAAGVALYEAHGTSSVVRKLLACGETQFTRGKLAQELAKLVVAAPAPRVHVVDTSAKRVEKTAEPVQVDPQRREWFAERNYLHAQLELVATDEERRVMALRILELADLLALSYDQAAGRAPTPPGQASPELEALDDVGDILRRLLNLRAQRSKLKKRPDRANDLLQVEANIHLLESKLNRHE